MLKVQFYRIENVLVMEILEQGKEIKKRGGVFFEDKNTGITLSSVMQPAMDGNDLYIMGRYKNAQYERKHPIQNKAYKRFPDEESAKAYMRLYSDTIAHYNNSIRKVRRKKQIKGVECINAY